MLYTWSEALTCTPTGLTIRAGPGPNPTAPIEPIGGTTGFSKARILTLGTATDTDTAGRRTTGTSGRGAGGRRTSESVLRDPLLVATRGTGGIEGGAIETTLSDFVSITFGGGAIETTLSDFVSITF